MKLSISMTNREIQLGWCFFFLSIFALPMAIDLVCDLLGLSLSLTLLNIIFFVINFACIVGIFHHFLWESAKAAWAKKWKSVQFVFTGLCVDFACSLLVSIIISPWIDPDFSNINDNAIIEMSKSYTAVFIFCTVVLVPITEEILFRGLVFGTIYEKHPKLAFCVSILAFTSVHLLDYIGTADWKTLLICFIQYLPAGLALAGSYAVSDNIVTPIFIHIINNAFAMIALR